MMLVIDITKGIQTQTAECLVIGEVTCQKMIVVLNKTDLLPEGKRTVLVDKVTELCISLQVNKICRVSEYVTALVEKPHDETQLCKPGVQESLLSACMSYYSCSGMERVGFFSTLLSIYKTTQHHSSEKDCNIKTSHYSFH